MQMNWLVTAIIVVLFAILIFVAKYMGLIAFD